MNLDTVRPIVSAPAGESESGAGSSDTSGSLAQAKQALAQTARDTAARIKSATNETASRVKTTAKNVAEDTKAQTAERIGGYSSAMRESAKSFEQQDPNIAWATHRVADRLQSVADYVRNSDFDQLRRDGEDVARRHPVAFFGGMLLAGLVVGNLLKARPAAVEETDEFDPDAPAALAETEPDFGNQSGSEDIPEFPETPMSTGL
jgi:hypothetical protein